VKGVTADVAVERKSLVDFVACAGRERARFLRELARLRGYRHAVVIVEADWRALAAGRWRCKVSADTVLSSICSWSARFCPILLAGDRQGGEDACRRFLQAVARHEHERLRAFAVEV
jgi:ERCC4-type nuclease